MVSNADLESIIETLEILRDSKRFNLQTDVLCVAKELKQYRAIGTVEECRQAAERMKAKIEVGDIVYCEQTKEKAVVICKTVEGKKCKVMFDDFDIVELSYYEFTKTGEQINLQELLK